MAVLNLITATEVVKYGPSDHNNDCQFEASQISITEYRFLVGDGEKECFGEDFYEALLADVRPCTGYDSQADYAINSIVVYDGKYYKATLAINQSITGTVLPTAAGGLWVQVGKFVTAAYNTLWDTYLAQFLAFAVVHSTVYKKSIRNTSSGYMRNQVQDAEAADVKELQLIKADIFRDVQTLWNRMHKFLVANKDTYPLYPENCKKTCTNRKSAGVFLAPRNKSDECCG